MSSLSDVLPGARPPQRPGRRAEERKRRKRAKKRRRRTAVVLLVALVLVGGGVVAAFAGLAPLVRGVFAPNDYEGAGTGSAVKIEVSDGDSGRQIARTLESKDVVKTVKAFADLAATDKRSQRIQPGLYELKTQMSAESALTWLADPDHRLLVRVTIPEGRRVTQILDQLSKSLSLPLDELTAASKNAPAIGLPAAAKGKPEGYLFPSTYDFRPDVTPVEALKTMVARNAQTLADLGVPEDQVQSLMIRASIIQAEGRHAEDFGKIATVLTNRLQTNMKLQLDSTVSYAVGRFGVTTTPAERAVASPYNTYKYPGLPAGPIGNPGKAAMDAVLHPTPGTWLFFTAVNPSTGETKFATTLAEKAAMDAEFQAWLRDHPQG